MNSRFRVKAIPAIVAASFGIGTFGHSTGILAHNSQASATAQTADFEEIALTIEKNGVTGMPENIASNRYLVNITGPASMPGEMPSGVLFAQFPEGMTVQQALDDTMAANDEPPAWYNNSTFPGGVFVNEDGKGWTILDLKPGKWVVTTLFGTTLGVEFEVTGEFPEDAPEPDSNVSLNLSEMVISVDAGEFKAGDNVVAVCNTGADLHFVDVGKVPDGTTVNQVEAMFDVMMTGTPVPDGLTEDDLVPTTYMPELSGGNCQWLPISLEPGTYFLSCWVTDEESGMPHAMMGMWTLITVE